MYFHKFNGMVEVCGKLCICMLMILFICMEASRVQNATVILHIGPHKTGSSYLQASMQRMSGHLLAKGYCFDTKDSLKHHYHDLAIAFYERRDVKAISKFQHIWDCLNRGNKVIISSETFSVFDSVNKLQFVKPFFQNHHVHIVSFHRNPMSLLYSVYTEIMKTSDRAIPFSSFIFRHHQEYDKAFYFKFLNAYASTFGRDDLTIVDYDGAKAAKRDIALVFLCDIMGILCDAKLPLANKPVNSQPLMLKFNLFHIVRNYLLGLGCSFHQALTPANVLEIIQGYDRLVEELPIIRMNAPILQDLAQRVDDQLRREFGDRMLYNDPIAARRQIESFYYYEVDEHAFLSNTTWTTWMRKEVKTLSQRRYVRNCHRMAVAAASS